MGQNFHAKRVPGAENAILEDTKLLEYALNLVHPQGGPKARFFLAIGYGREDFEELKGAFLDSLPLLPASLNKTDPDGVEFWEVAITIRRRNEDGVAEVLTVWEVREDRPTRFVTAYPA